MEYEMQMTHAAINAASWLLANTPSEGSRVECRCHARCSRSLKTQCMYKCDPRTCPQTGQELIDMKSKEGIWSLPEDHFKFFKDVLDKQFKKTIPGVLTEGFDELGDAVDSANVMKAAETAANSK
jgi:hypothetical protein